MHAAFVSKHTTIEHNKYLPGREALFELLQERDIVPVHALGAEEAFAAETLTVTHGNGTRTDISYSQAGALINRSGRSLKYAQIPVAQEVLPPMINENATRSLAWRKDQMHDRVLAPFGIAIPTVLATDADALSAFTTAHPSSKVMVKSRHNALSAPAQSVPQQELCDMFADQPDMYGTRIVQPQYDFSIPLPSAIRPYSAGVAEHFALHAAAPAMKEVRMYTFHSPQQTDTFPVGRVLQDGEDHWFFVDPESVPGDLSEKAQAAIQKAAAISGAVAMYGTVDFGYGQLDGGAPEWRAIELNGLTPYLLGYDKSPAVAHTVHSMYADQITATCHAQ